MSNSNLFIVSARIARVLEVSGEFIRCIGCCCIRRPRGTFPASTHFFRMSAWCAAFKILLLSMLLFFKASSSDMAISQGESSISIALDVSAISEDGPGAVSGVSATPSLSLSLFSRGSAEDGPAFLLGQTEEKMHKVLGLSSKQLPLDNIRDEPWWSPPPGEL